jgi:hypothetical protein
MDIMAILLGFLFLGYSANLFYSWWLKPKDSANLARKKRKEYREDLFFMPQTLMFGFYDKNPSFEIWINRLASLFFLFISVMVIYVGFLGPFHAK